ncbi:MAG: LodA/GoxA family CTQ-dependent oxidase, partial [Armatimonadota bacterium]|nr:LodA/GoxA family CTQ-dependent oxidase [Armatimonadota bacterium]
MDTITHCKIHPSIGVARVGNSPDAYFIGPEVPHAAPAPDDGYKDASGRLKRQAARFRIFGYNAADQPVQELTADDAQITWVAHVANKKAAWYNFELAMDIPEAKNCTRRNAAVTDRTQLVIDPGGRSIAGKNQSGPNFQFDTGTFFGKAVSLGELRTDDAGRLLFLGGRGVSAPAQPGHTAYTFANNDGWHDDTADGPVSAQVTLNGQDIPVEPAWVVVAPPSYAPDIITFQTMYDLIIDSFQNSWAPPITQPSFTDHILPILKQLSDAQWVNAGFNAQFGWQAPHDFSRPAFLAKLSSLNPTYDVVRQQLFHQFRDPGGAGAQASAWPPIYGDAAFTTPNNPRGLLALTPTQLARLKQWAHSDFVADWDPNAPTPPQSIDDVPITDRPHALDKAALVFCMGGPFHPGCEMTWPMRHAILYSGPFRIRRWPQGQPEPDYGATLTPSVA